MKKILTVILVLAMVFGVGAFATAEEWSYETPMKIGFSQNKLSVAFRVAGVEQLKAYVAEKGLNWEIIVTDGNNDASKQTSDIEDMIMQGVDAIICCPVTADTMAPAGAIVMEAGIPFVLVNRRITSEDFTCAITGSNYMIGQLVADDMAAKLGEKGKVALIEGTLGASDTTDRTTGFLETIAKYPDIEMVAQTSGDYVKDKGMACMEDILMRVPDLDGVFCQNDDMAQGAYLACEAAGATDVLIYGNDCYRSTLDMIKEGKIEGTTIYPTSVQAAVDVLISIFENGGVYEGEKIIVQDVPLATIDNLDQYYDTLALNA
ncbi:MAG: sugar ABC transporter substrate-binding protein [Clostridiales bacterium]|nr:substrate-binding domain-containing protein [Bacillota bacterium]NLL55476.1 sugar ABC transporter substrate-binding protein [Clostridiales bacterium]